MDETPQVETIQLEKREPTVSKSFRLAPDEAQCLEEVAKAQGVSETCVIRNGLKAIGIVKRIRV